MAGRGGSDRRLTSGDATRPWLLNHPATPLALGFRHAKRRIGGPAAVIGALRISGGTPFLPACLAVVRSVARAKALRWNDWRSARVTESEATHVAPEEDKEETQGVKHSRVPQLETRHIPEGDPGADACDAQPRLERARAQHALGGCTTKDFALEVVANVLHNPRDISDDFLGDPRARRPENLPVLPLSRIVHPERRHDPHEGGRLGCPESPCRDRLGLEDAAATWVIFIECEFETKAKGDPVLVVRSREPMGTQPEHAPTSCESENLFVRLVRPCECDKLSEHRECGGHRAAVMSPGDLENDCLLAELVSPTESPDRCWIAP